MIIVNGEKLPIYILDTEESILLRIATKLKTLKKYLYNVPSPVPRQDGTRLEVVNLIAKAQEYASKSIDFGDFVNDYPQLGQPLLGDLCKIWIAYNKVLCGSGDESDAAKQIFTLSEGAKYITDVEAVCREKVDIFRRLNSEINVEKELSRKTDTGFKELEEQKALATTPFKVESVALDITLDLADVTLLEMFNYLLLDQSVPFASCKNYYKILKNFVPPDEWGVQEHDQLTLKVSRKDGEFETAKLRMEGELLDEKTILSVTISSEKGGLSREQYLQHILGRFRRKAYKKQR